MRAGRGRCSGLLALLRVAPGPLRGAAQRRSAAAGGVGWRASSPGPALYAGITGALALGGLRRPALGAVAGLPPGALRFPGRVRDREQPSGGSRPPRGRLRAGRARDEDPRQVPARARGRAVRAAPGADLRQGLPAHVRRVPRPRRPAVRRRVQLALRQRRGARAARPALGGRPATAPPPPARDERRPRRARGDRDPDGHRHLGVEGERQQVAGDARRPRRSRRRPSPEGQAAAPRGDGAARLDARDRARRQRDRQRRLRRHDQQGRSGARDPGHTALGADRLAGEPPHQDRRQARARARRCSRASVIVTKTGWHRARKRPRSSRRAPSSSAATGTTATGRTSRRICSASASSRLGSRSSATTRPTSSRRFGRGSSTTCSSSRAGSGRRTTTARSSCSRTRPASALHVDEELEAAIEELSRLRRRAAEAAVRRLRARRAQAGDASGRARSGWGSSALRPRSCCRSAIASPSRLPGPPRELQALWPRVLETAPLRRLLARAVAPRAARAADVRRLGVGRRAGARRRGRRRRRRGGHDLRARLRAPRRPLRPARRRRARRRARAGVRSRGREVRLLARRAVDGRARARRCCASAA